MQSLASALEVLKAYANDLVPGSYPSRQTIAMVLDDIKALNTIVECQEAELATYRALSTQPTFVCLEVGALRVRHKRIRRGKRIEFEGRVFVATTATAIGCVERIEGIFNGKATMEGDRMDVGRRKTPSSWLPSSCVAMAVAATIDLTSRHHPHPQGSGMISTEISTWARDFINRPRPPVHVHDRDHPHGRWCSMARVYNCIIWLRHSSKREARAHVNDMRCRGFAARVRRWKAPRKRPLAQRGRA